MKPSVTDFPGLVFATTLFARSKKLSKQSQRLCGAETELCRCGVTRAAIEQQGYAVLVTRNKKEAFDILEHKPDKVVLVVMPRRMFDRALMIPGAQVLITN